MGSTRVIQASAVSPKTVSTRFSSGRQAPVSGSSSAPLKVTERVSHSPMSGRKISTTGRPSAIHSPKPMVAPKVSS